jgi:hypothetical protein
MFPDAADRAAIVGSRFDSRQVQANGHLAATAGSLSDSQPATAAEVGAALRASEAAQQQARYAHTAAVRGSSGEGWL